MKDIIGILMCPLCKSNMASKGNSLLCQRNHCYDIAKTGYVNFLNKQGKQKYNKKLFTARKEVSEKGFFDKAAQKSLDMMATYYHDLENVWVADMGCGEGSFLRLMEASLPQSVRRVGVDIAKEGIAMAAKSTSKSSYFVSDISYLPFRDESFDVLLNVLSPSNYLEFQRVLKKNGLIIKIVPGLHYLKELRSIFMPEKNYSNEKMIRYFQEHFQMFAIETICYDFIATDSIMQRIIAMTPLSFHISEEAYQKARLIPKVTVDFVILAGINKQCQQVKD